MRHRKGPTKKLAPTIAPDTSCPHTFTEDEGIQLEVDCTDCAGAHDLSNTKCLMGVLNVVSAGAEPDVVILKRYIHRRYRGDLVRMAAFAASELSALNRALASVEQPSDKECRTCVVSQNQMIAAMKRKLLENPMYYVSNYETVVLGIREKLNSSSCASARVCAEKGFSASTLYTSR